MAGSVMRAALLASLLTVLPSPPVGADQHGFPADFEQPPQVIGGAGGGSGRDLEALAHLPVIMIADAGRVHDDWLGSNCGLASASVYQTFLDHGFAAGELWMLDLVPAQGQRLTSLELRTDNLKEMIFAVMGYTGADQVVLLAHGAGAVLAQATLVKYNLFYAVHSVAWIAGPFHGSHVCSFERCAGGEPMCCALTPGADFLQDVLIPDETPFDPSSRPHADAWTSRYLTVRNGRRFGDAWFRSNPESPALLGALNLSFSNLDHDGLRCSPEVLAEVIGFLTVPARPFDPSHDLDRDGFEGPGGDGPDCNDRDPGVYPGAPETCDDGVDQDCNRVDISCLPGKDRDLPPTRRPQASGHDRSDEERQR
jgi:hypothetical protein